MTAREYDVGEFGYNKSVALKINSSIDHMIADNGVVESGEMRFTLESFIILLMTVLIIFANILTLLIVFQTDVVAQVNRHFFISLTVADLGIGVCVCPFSFWTSMFDNWIYGEKFCHVQAYVAAIFWIGSVYSLSWIGIDHYVAIRKPDRYESLMTSMRARCWCTIIWVAAISFCSPPLFGVSRAQYYKSASICIIDWTNQKAYFITSGLLIIVPPIIALSVSNFYIFTDVYRQKKQVYEKSTDSNTRPDLYILHFILGIVFLISWFPWCILQLQEVFQDLNGGLKAPAKVHFFFMWLAVGNSFWKFLLYIILDHDFRVGIKILYAKMRGQYVES